MAKNAKQSPTHQAAREVLAKPSDESTDRSREIEELAYTLWQQRGCPHGSADEDWLAAEQMLRAAKPQVVEPRVLAAGSSKIGS